MVHLYLRHETLARPRQSKMSLFLAIYIKLSPILFQIQFFMNFLNIIDLFGILPFFISVLLNLLNSQYSLEWMTKAAQIFRILRILRIFKLSRHITGLKTLGLTLRNSHRYEQINPLLIRRYWYHTLVNHWFCIMFPPGSYCFSLWL